MPLLFNTLLVQESIPLSAVRLLRHQDQRAHKGRTPYQLWRNDRAGFEVYQSHHSIQNRPKLKAQFWASFVGTPDGQTIFVGLYRCSYKGLLEREIVDPHTLEVAAPGSCDAYELSLDLRFQEFEGRIIIEWGPGTRAWAQRADGQNKQILEIKPFGDEPPFPGFSAFIEPLSKIETLPLRWCDALRASRGVYLLTCPRTREQYVGSAYGQDGFLGRWLSYAQSGHGGNVGLKSRSTSDYQVSILEVVGNTMSEAEIIALEGRWKRKLQSLEMGLNRN